MRDDLKSTGALLVYSVPTALVGSLVLLAVAYRSARAEPTLTSIVRSTCAQTEEAARSGAERMVSQDCATGRLGPVRTSCKHVEGVGYKWPIDYWSCTATAFCHLDRSS